jgi:asparagine synthase (glutamine-hydrolysing)
MRNHCSGQLKTFSVGINAGQKLNEADQARTVARHLETDHHELLLSADDMPALLAETAVFLDEPVSDPAAVPTYLLAKLARKSVTVVLTGEGSDETWAGYNVFRKGLLVANYRRLPSWLRRSLTDPVLRCLPGSDAGTRFVAASRNPAYLARLFHFDLQERMTLYTRDYAQELADESEEDNGHAPVLDPTDPFGSITRDLIASHLAERLLFKVDRMTMAHSLEARVPFLDYKLIEFAVSVPGRLRLRGHQTKYLLRKTFVDYLPEFVLKRPKHGFDLPCSEWLRSTIAPLANELFAKTAFPDLLDQRRVATLWKRHLRGEIDHGAQIWALMTLELWGRAFRNA